MDKYTRRRTSFRFNLAPGRHSSRRRNELSETGMHIEHIENDSSDMHKLGFQQSNWNTNFLKTKVGHSDTALKLTIVKINPQCQNPDEFKVIKMSLLAKHIEEVTRHAAICAKSQLLAAAGTPPIQLVGVTQTQGLANYMKSVCVGCNRKFLWSTSEKIQTPSGEHFESNVRAVWGGQWLVVVGLPN